MENQKALKKVSDKDLRKVFLHSLAIMCSWNYERQMHMGFMYGMAPVLDKLYADDEERNDKGARWDKEGIDGKSGGSTDPEGKY